MGAFIVGLNRQRIILYRLFVFGDTNLFKCISIEMKKETCICMSLFMNQV